MLLFIFIIFTIFYFTILLFHHFTVLSFFLFTFHYFPLFSILHFFIFSADVNHRPSEALQKSKAYIQHVERTILKIEEFEKEHLGLIDMYDEEKIMRMRLLHLSMIEVKNALIM